MVEHVVDLSRFDRIDTNCFSCCQFVMLEVDFHVSSRFACIVISRILTSGGLYRVVENVVDSSRFHQINTNHFSCCQFVMPEVDLQDVTQCESS